MLFCVYSEMKYDFDSDFEQSKIEIIDRFDQTSCLFFLFKVLTDLLIDALNEESD